MQKVIIKNTKAVITCDVQDNVFYDTDILIDGAEIIAIDKNIQQEDCQIINGESLFVYPGLVNTHHHFFQSFVRNIAAIDMRRMPLTTWLKTVYSIFQKVNSDVVYYASMVSMADLIKHGCTCAFDHQYCYTLSSGMEPIDRQMDAANQIGMRFHAGRGTNTLPQSEGSTIPDDMCETTDVYMRDCERLIDLYHDNAKFSMHRIVMAPCQPINCRPETFTETVKLARAKKVFMHTHLGEGENEIMQERWGKRSINWCEDIGFVGPDVWYAHGFEFTPEEYKTLAANGTGVSHCPSANAVSGNPILDVRAMLDAGVPLSLGCDGGASNDGSNLLDSVRMGYLLQMLFGKERGHCITAYDMLKIATVGGAKMLGRDDIGTIEVGKAADLFMLDAGRLDFVGATQNPRDIIAKLGLTGEVYMTMINGKVVFRDGKLTNIDERDIAKSAESILTSVLRSQFPIMR